MSSEQSGTHTAVQTKISLALAKLDACFKTRLYTHENIKYWMDRETEIN